MWIFCSTQNSVYYYWHILTKCKQQLANDPLDLAKKFIEVYNKEYHVELLDTISETETQSLTFQVTDFVNAWAYNTQELVMDSTCMQSILLL